MSSNKLVIAAAGSGKTTFLVKEALKQKSDRVLITTFTEANEKGIRQKFIEKNKCIPENVTVQTWFSLLLQHGVKPYQGVMFKPEIEGLILENGQSAKGIPEINTARHYFTNTRKIYSDKISKFVIKCNEKTNGEVIRRLSRIYSQIYIDEVQDFAGYDLDLLKLLFASNIMMLLVGDPRQATYSTNNSSKNKKFKKSDIINFFEDDSLDLLKDDSSLTINYRCIQPICTISNKLYPQHKPTVSGNTLANPHRGIYLIKTTDVADYLAKYNPMQLRDKSDTKGVNENYRAINFGKSKGLEFERVLIYPTRPFIEWLENNNSALAPTSRSKFYVALTRAIFSVGIVYDFDAFTNIDSVAKFDPNLEN